MNIVKDIQVINPKTSIKEGFSFQSRNLKGREEEIKNLLDKTYNGFTIEQLVDDFFNKDTTKDYIDGKINNEISEFIIPEIFSKFKGSLSRKISDNSILRVLRTEQIKKIFLLKLKEEVINQVNNHFDMIMSEPGEYI